MGKDTAGCALTMLGKRCIEAATLADMYAVLVTRFDQATALAVIEDTVKKSAYVAGRAFAASAPDGPCLAHFATIPSLWQAGGALVIENERREAKRFSFEVTRCRYAESYREMGLPEALTTRISCLRDGAFVAGYSDKLRLTRPATIASGAPCCPFTFTWEEA